MIQRDFWWIGLLALAACAAPSPVSVNPALFARAAVAAESKAAGRVALLVPPQVAGTTSPVLDRPLQTGQIAEQAMSAALADGLRSGFQRVLAVPAASGGFSATMVIDAVRFDYEVRLLWPLPILGYFGGSELSTRLALDITMLDAQGSHVWTRTYDSGREVWKAQPGRSESLSDGVVRQAHEAALRLSQQALRDLREGLDADRMKARDL